MARILLLLVVGFFAWLLFRGIVRKQRPPQGRTPVAPEAEDMVACAICGVNMPRSEAKQENGRFTCSDPAACKHAG